MFNPNVFVKAKAKDEDDDDRHSKSLFSCSAQREVFLDIPAEDREPCDEKKAGKLNLSLYGTRDAALNWQQALSDHLVKAGFKRGVG